MAKQADDILIVGGYGSVGRHLAAWLAPVFPDRLVIAGRRLDAARAAAQAVGYGCRARALDLAQPPADADLGEVGQVVVCVDQVDTAFARLCLTKGIDYLDITASLEWLQRLTAFDELARETGASGLISLGTTPGLTNQMGAWIAGHADGAHRLDLLVEFGTGETHGDAALDWMFDHLNDRFEVREEGRWRTVRGFGEKRRFRGNGKRGRWGYRFNLPDQQILATDLAIPTVGTWVRFSSTPLTALIALTTRLGVVRLLKWPLARRWVKRGFSQLAYGSDCCTLVAESRSAIGQRQWLVLSARQETRLTAAVAAASLVWLRTRGLPGGVHHLHQVLTLDDLLPQLRQWLPDLELDSSVPGT
ncbi:saccharopine dehydrogenase NADP-binding domain-containing protein [Saccharospirillum salsuginis]|uniref:Saccharopine dehydrogenase NADP binding domain-containing protein n=1 Tax=Saccharospirillum salsuginis TaxID=418750 RepID=A0A918KLF0_9GAMM|nr:saccharopine dehydrogenase NADP-binding domain-containing protein [Saccharospirillum salsuginis]GGX68344.1 hypothetical protein GCM10007392_39890 [Saccharospirillum salsuginis]